MYSISTRMGRRGFFIVNHSSLFNRFHQKAVLAAARKGIFRNVQLPLVPDYTPPSPLLLVILSLPRL